MVLQVIGSGSKILRIVLAELDSLISVCPRIIYLTRNGNSATFLSNVCNAKKI